VCVLSPCHCTALCVSAPQSMYVPCLGVSMCCLFVCLFVCVCVLRACLAPRVFPALLLNNPAYHLLLSDQRDAAAAAGPSPAQEKSLNVPQGKRPPTPPGWWQGEGETLQGRAPPLHTPGGAINTPLWHQTQRYLCFQRPDHRWGGFLFYILR